MRDGYLGPFVLTRVWHCCACDVTYTDTWTQQNLSWAIPELRSPLGWKVLNDTLIFCPGHQVEIVVDGDVGNSIFV